MIDILICAIAVTAWSIAIVVVIAIMSDIDDEFDLSHALIDYINMQNTINCGKSRLNFSNCSGIK